jgi:hypothetical protein
MNTHARITAKRAIFEREDSATRNWLIPRDQPAREALFYLSHLAMSMAVVAALTFGFFAYVYPIVRGVLR